MEGLRPERMENLEGELGWGWKLRVRPIAWGF